VAARGFAQTNSVSHTRIFAHDSTAARCGRFV
jgi:hypothetical protein